MRTCLYGKLFLNRYGYNIEVSINISRWLIGFGWFSGSPRGTHFNLGPVAITFYKNDD